MTLASLATSSNTFGFELWSRLGAAPGNLAISPASISAALAMTCRPVDGPRHRADARLMPGSNRRRTRTA